VTALQGAQTIAEQAARGAGAVALRGYRGRHEITSKGGTDIVTEFDHAAEKAALAVIRAAYPRHGILAEESGRAQAPSRSRSGNDLDLLWMVDPIDGTHNYAAQLPFWCVSVAAVDPTSGAPQVGVIFDPLHDEMFSTVRGGGASLNGAPMHVSDRSSLRNAVVAYDIGHGAETAPRMVSLLPVVQPHVGRVRHMGSAALSLAYVAAGRLDGFYHLNLYPWDVAAGMLLVAEAGGVASDWDGRPRTSGEGPVVAAGADLHPQLVALLHSGDKR
jgi:myo-inositol-1(or 4)-monophosphatase